MVNDRSNKNVQKLGWKKGAENICRLCGTPIKESQLSKNNFKRAYELKWCTHYSCYQKMINMLDRETR